MVEVWMSLPEFAENGQCMASSDWQGDLLEMHFPKDNYVSERLDEGRFTSSEHIGSHQKLSILNPATSTCDAGRWERWDGVKSRVASRVVFMFGPAR